VRHADALPGATAPRPPSFNEADVSDKPTWVQVLPSLGEADIAQVDEYFRARLQTLLAVDEMVAGLVAALDAAGTLDNTYIVFTSDNGYDLGEHRIVREKGSPYEEAIHMPLVVRGPGVPAGETIAAIGSQVDLGPTFAAWADAAVPDFVDGRSLVPLLGGGPAPEPWRQTALIEQFANRPDRSTEQPAFEAVRGDDFVYVEYATGERELYALADDPYEEQNLAATAAPDLLQALSERVSALQDCAADTCRTVEEAPLPDMSALAAASA
jgi:arylsulfatase A-like enzyme